METIKKINKEKISECVYCSIKKTTMHFDIKLKEIHDQILQVKREIEKKKDSLSIDDFITIKSNLLLLTTEIFPLGFEMCVFCYLYNYPKCTSNNTCSFASVSGCCLTDKESWYSQVQYHVEKLRMLFSQFGFLCKDAEECLMIDKS